MTSEQPDPSLEELIVSASYPQDPQLSPDGRRVAWVATPYTQEGQYPESLIWVAMTDGSAPARKFTSGNGCDQRPRWSPDGASLAFLSDREQDGINAIYWIPVDGGEARQVVARKSTITAFEWSPDGRALAFTSPDEPTADDERREKERNDANVYGERWNSARLHVLDIESGNVRTVPSGDRHVSDFTWSPDSARIAWMSQPTPELETRSRSKLFTVPVDGERPVEVCTVDRWVINDLRWTADGRYLVFLAAHEKTLSGLTTFVVDPEGGEPRVLAPGISEDVCANAYITVPGTPRVLLAVARGLSTSLEWVDTDSLERELLFEPDEGDISHEFSAVVPNEQEPVIAVIHSTGTEPPELHVGPPDALRRVSDHHASFAHFSFGMQEPFYWTAQDGLELDGLLIRPPDASEGPLPTIVHVHGGPYGRYTAGWNLRPGHWAQYLAANGFAVLMPNYRGGQGHGNDFAKWAHGGVGDKEFQDVMSAVDAAIEQGIADPDRLGIGGWSQGGFMTAWAVTQTNRFKAGVMGAGVSDWNMMVMTSDIPTIESMLGGNKPWDGPGPHRSQEHSPISFARNVETPVLILHGEEDARVPVSQAIGYHRALVEYGVESQLVTYPREPHGIRERNHQLDLLRRVREWFQRWV